MGRSCLELIQRAALRVGIATTPNAAVSSSDAQIRQLVELMNEEGQEQSARFAWQAMVQEATFTTVAAELQTTMAAITTGFRYVVNNTIWNRTLQRPVYGPHSPQDWQQSKAALVAGPFNSFRIVRDNLYFDPAPTAGETCAFEYVTEHWVTLAAGGGSDEWGSDTDTCLLPDRLMLLGTIWRWKQAKGLTYAEDFNKYEMAVADAINRDGPKPTLNMVGATSDVPTVVVIPAGSWGGHP